MDFSYTLLRLPEQEIVAGESSSYSRDERPVGAPRSRSCVSKKLLKSATLRERPHCESLLLNRIVDQIYLLRCRHESSIDGYQENGYSHALDACGQVIEHLINPRSDCRNNIQTV